ncbi:MAG: hypothetical protein C5B57_01485 [Blastocatellia bacterium]|nr:MAG: hypothetical protein C5B57_01485 [Blastocatellia bacterium]
MHLVRLDRTLAPFWRGASRTMTSILRTLAICAAAALLCRPQHVFSHETLTTTVLFDREIVRILNKHCVMCHADHGPSFPIETYDQAWVRGRKIRADVIARHMPPWAAVPGYGQFANDNSLTLRETQFIVSWVEGLGPRNAGTVFTNITESNASRPKEVRAHPDFGRWQLGEPNLIRPLPATTIEAGAARAVTRSVIDLGLITERRARAVEYLPGDRRVVRAAFFTVQETGQWLGSWTPWYGFFKLPEGSAYRLRAGSHVVAEIHYQGTDERIVDRGRLGLSFADDVPASAPSDIVLDAEGDVPSGAASQRFRAAIRLPVDSYALALRPEIQRGVESIEVSARRPDGGTDVLLFAKDPSLDWPTPYIFKDPVLLRRGTELSVTAYSGNDGNAARRGGVRLTVSRIVRGPGSGGPGSESRELK